MARLTREFLEANGFSAGQSRDHNYRTGYTRWYDDVERSITFLSTLDIVDYVRDNFENERFDVYFWGHDIDHNGRYAQVDSHLTISTVEELNTLMAMLRD